MSLEHPTPDRHVGEALGEWRTHNHQSMEWYLDASSCTLYHHAEGVWTKHDAMNIAILPFQVDAHSCDTPNQYNHGMDVCKRARYMDIVGKHTLIEPPTTTTTTQHSIQ
jgi:hypothetical protein